MRKTQQIYDLEIPDDDYKMAIVMQRDKENFESPNIWFYVGADITNHGFAKVGITMGDLRSRSYSSANPNYFLFCAFQCDQCTTRLELESIEHAALNYLDAMFCWDNGLTKRARHVESQRLSECYYHINFEEFFACLHDYLLDNHGRYFQTADFENDEGFVEGYALSWQFFPRLKSEVKRQYLRKILRG